MRADRVKPGMVVKDDEGIWQVVVDRVGTCLYYPGGREEWALNEDAEAVRLTAPQVAALWRVNDVKVIETSAGWLIDNPALRRPVAKAGTRSVFERVRDLGLIAKTGERRPVGAYLATAYTVTPSGRALLGILDSEKAT